MPCKEAGATFVTQKPATFKDSFEPKANGRGQVGIAKPPQGRYGKAPGPPWPVARAAKPLKPDRSGKGFGPG